MTWMSRALCRTRPADWWDTGDDGNRLALMLCSVCPVAPRCSELDEPHGVIVGGAAYDQHGRRLPLCPCGRPTPNTERVDCFTCTPRWDTLIPRVRRKMRRFAADLYGDRILAMRSGGASYRDIVRETGLPFSTVRRVVARAHPQAVSTVVDA